MSHEHPLRPRIRRRRARPARRPADSYDLTAQAGDLAADHPDRVQRLVVSEAFLPGITPPYPLLVPAARNEKLWHIAFNRCAEVNERLVRGREDVFLGIEHDTAAVKKLPDDVVAYHVEMLRSDEHSLRGSFGWYRAVDTSIAQNQQRAAARLAMPVIAIGAEFSNGATVGATMELVADDVQTLVIAGVGHWVAEEAPDLRAAAAAFLGPYRDAAAAAVPTPRAQTATPTAQVGGPALPL